MYKIIARSKIIPEGVEQVGATNIVTHHIGDITCEMKQIVVVVSGVVTAVVPSTTKQGEPLASITIQDGGKEITVTVSPSLYPRVVDRLQVGSHLVIRGEVFLRYVDLPRSVAQEPYLICFTGAIRLVEEK